MHLSPRIAKWVAELQKIDWGLALISITGAINFGAGYVAEKTGRKNSSPAITATGKHLKSDAWSTAGILDSGESSQCR